MFAYGAGPVPPGRPGHRPRQHLHRRRQAAAQGRRRHRLRGRPDRDRDPRRRHRRRRRTSPPTWSARPSTTRWPPRVLVTAVASGSPTRSRPSSTSRSRSTRHAERIRTALAGQQSGDRAGRRPRAGPRRRQRLRRRAPRDPHRATPPPCAARVRNAGAIFVGPVRPGVASATTAPAPTTCCRPRGCACHSSGLSVRAFRKVGARRRLHPRGARRGRRPRGHARRGRGPARPRRRGPRPVRRTEAE